MSKIKVRLFANLREYTGAKELGLEAGTVKESLEKLCKKFPGLENMIFQGEDIRPYMNVFLNGRNISELNGLGTALNSGDEIAIFPPVSGGQCLKKEQMQTRQRSCF
jgi:molybdopterin synthase sulfur carrier subunit